MSKKTRENEMEKESIKKEYEELIKNIKQEYFLCNKELKTVVDSKNEEI